MTVVEGELGFKTSGSDLSDAVLSKLNPNFQVSSGECTSKFHGSCDDSAKGPQRWHEDLPSIGQSQPPGTHFIPLKIVLKISLL